MSDVSSYDDGHTGCLLYTSAQDDMAVAPEENTEEIPEATEDGTVLDGTAQDDMSVTPVSYTHLVSKGSSVHDSVSGDRI